ncbi:hypothetical protein [Streptomyces sioyaensis]|uniref:hypothetical protein n=1 Tax=Streptomyces sioyaensis TaxID=67364 RepID=UPI0036E7841A
MAAEDASQVLFDEVCETLARAGFDVHPAGDGEAAGLRLRREADAVMVGWRPGGRRRNAEYEGIRSALRHALLAILTQAGHAVQVDGESGDVQVRRPASSQEAE